MHPHVRGAGRRLERLKEMDRPAPEPPGSAPERQDRAEAVERLQSSEEKQESPKPRSNTEDPYVAPEHRLAEEPPRRRSWWREYFGFD